MDNIAVILPMLVAALVGYIMLKPKPMPEKINELDKEKSRELGKLEIVKEQTSELKEQVTKEQANVSEEGKKGFWEDYAKKDE